MNHHPDLGHLIFTAEKSHGIAQGRATKPSTEAWQQAPGLPAAGTLGFYVSGTDLDHFYSWDILVGIIYIYISSYSVFFGTWDFKGDLYV